MFKISYIPSEGQIRVDVLVYGTGLDYDPTYSGIGSALIEIGPSAPKDNTHCTTIYSKKHPIPDWIKNNA